MQTTRKHAIHTLEQPNVPSSILAPVEVTIEQVEESTRQMIARLFPATGRGLDFLARFLRLTIVKQVAQAGAGPVDVAEISVTGIRQLAPLIGWSYDTTEKYVRLFCALGLLSRTRENGLVVLRFALCHSVLPVSLAQLDLLIAGPVLQWPDSRSG